MKAALLLGALALVTLGGCTISAVGKSDDPRPKNECSMQADCRNTELCSEGMCQPLNGQLESLLLEITPPADSSVPSLSFTVRVDDVPTSGGELKVRSVFGAKVTGNLHLPPSASCYPTLPQDGVPLPAAADGTLPVTVTFIARERLLGVPQRLYATSSKFQLDANSPTYLSYRFDTVVPVGEYDVYVVPPRGQQDCVVPPQLFRRQKIETDNTQLDYPAAIAATLNVHLMWPRSELSLDGWVADVIEPLDGRTISSSVLLTEPAIVGDELEYVIPLVYSTVTEINPAKGEGKTPGDLVRLRPPEGAALPTILFDREALRLLAEDEPRIKGFTRYPAPVTVMGQLARKDDGSPISGQVKLVSTAITGVDPGVFASFQTTVSVAENGMFSVELPPGKYRVLALPDDARSSEGLAALETEWEIRGMVSPQAGKLLELSEGHQIRGASSFGGALVSASPTPRPVLPFEQAFGAAPFMPRSRSGSVGTEDGTFALSVDAGRFDVSVRVPESLGYAWYVRPGVVVGEESRDLGRLAAVVPSLVRGTTTAISAELDRETKQFLPVARSLPHASVRAYAYLDADFAYTRDPAAAVSVVQVAETRSDENGDFRLLVPSSLAASK